MDVMYTDQQRRRGEQQQQREQSMAIESGRHVTVIDRPSCNTWS